MPRKKTEPYPKDVLALMTQKNKVLMKAQVLSGMAMDEVGVLLWASAAGLEERIAPLLDGLGHDLEAAVHRISAASCYRKAGDLARAVNLFRAALAGPLLDVTRKEVSQMLAECLAELMRSKPAASRTR